MQIPPATSTAAQAAGIASQATSKDKASSGFQAIANSPATTSDVHVEQSGSSNSDRDAQGQGDGLPGETQEENQESGQEGNPSDTGMSDANPAAPAAVLPGEEPGELDIIG